MAQPLDGLTAIVTGAGRGLGRAEARELARLGANVVVNDFGQPGRDGSGEASAAPAEETAAEIRAAGGRAVAHLGDVADFEQAGALVQLAVDTYGQLDILVNNAGILRDRMIFSMSEDEWDSVIRVHLKGHFNTTHFAATHWRDALEGGRRPRLRPDRQHLLRGVPRGLGRPAQLRRGQGRHRRPHHLHGPGAGQIRRHRQRHLPARPHPDDRGRLRRHPRTRGRARTPSEGRPDPLAPEHVSPLVGYLASPAAAGVNGQLLVVHGGMVAIAERPRIAAKFDTAKDTFSYQELDELLTPYFAERPPGETFAAAEVLGLKHG